MKTNQKRPKGLLAPKKKKFEAAMANSKLGSSSLGRTKKQGKKGS